MTQTKTPLIHRRGLWFGLSIILTTLSIAALATWGLKIGIDFKGGQLLEAKFTNPITTESVRTELAKNKDLPSSTVVESGANTYLIRTATDSNDQLNALKEQLNKIGEWTQIRFENVGPTVGKDLTRKAVIAIALASLAIILYIAFAFRKVPEPTNSWQFGITAVIALLHDLLITLGTFSLLGHLYGFEVDSLFITALLTVMGFSVHDTIVTYDRIRENLLHRVGEMPFSEVVMSSINQTLVRSLNTSLTLILVLVSLIVLGGSTIRPFISALLVGVTAGAYSSIFFASQLLVVWQGWTERRNLSLRATAKQSN